VTLLVDTSALYALLDEDDGNHGRAADAWDRLLDAEPLLTHTYVVVEASALVHRRLGMAAARALHRTLLPPVRVLPVDAGMHGRAVERWLADDRRRLSLVDVTSFIVMRDRGLERAFAYDADFDREGYTTSL
jgi:predicted nucleic acid-binding protein